MGGRADPLTKLIRYCLISTVTRGVLPLSHVKKISICKDLGLHLAFSLAAGYQSLGFGTNKMQNKSSIK